jgi:chromosome segregation ATPase
MFLFLLQSSDSIPIMDWGLHPYPDAARDLSSAPNVPKAPNPVGSTPQEVKVANRIYELEQEVRSLKAALDRQQETTVSTEQFHIVCNANAKLAKEMEGLRSTIAHLTQHERNEENTITQLQLEKLQNKITGLNRQLDVQVKRDQKEIADLNNQLGQAKANTEKQRVRADQLQQQVEDLKAKIEQTDKLDPKTKLTIDGLRNQVNQLRESADHKKAEIESLRAQLLNAEAQVKTQRNRGDGLRDNAREINQKLMQSEEQLRETRTQLELLQKKFETQAEQDQKMKVLQAELKKFEANNARFLIKVTTLETQKKETQGELEQLRKRLRSLESEDAVLKSTDRKQKELRAAVDKKNEEHHREVAQLKAEIASLADELKNAKNQVALFQVLFGARKNPVETVVSSSNGGATPVRS